MKRFLCLLLVALMIVPVAMAESVDYSAMTAEELHWIIDHARNELSKREQLIAKDNYVLVDQDGITVTLNEEKISSSFLYVYGVFINNSGFKMGVSVDDAYINGWAAYSNGFTFIESGKKTKGYIVFSLDDADISSTDEIETIEFNVKVYKMDPFYKVVSVIPFSFTFDKK